MAESMIINGAYTPLPVREATNFAMSLNGTQANTPVVNAASSGDSFNASVGVRVSSPPIPKYYLDVMKKQYWLYAANDSAIRADNDKSPRLLSPETIQAELLNPKRIFKREDGTKTLLLDPNLLHSLLAQKTRIQNGELKFQIPPEIKDVYYLKAPFPRIQAEQTELRFQRDFQKSAGLWAAGMQPPESKLSPERPLAPRDPLTVERERSSLLRSKSYMEIPQSGVSVDRNIMLANILDDPREKRADKPYGEYTYSGNDDIDLFLNQAFKLPLGESSGAGVLHVRDLGKASVLISEAEANNLLDYRNIPDGHQASGDYRSLRIFATLIVPENSPGAGGVHDGLESGSAGSFGKIIYPVGSLEKLKDLLHSPLSPRIQISPRGELLRQITSGDKDEQAKVGATLMRVPAKYISIAADKNQQASILDFLRNNFPNATAIGGSANEFRTAGHPSVGRTYLTVEEPDPIVKEANQTRDIQEDPEKRAKKCEEISNERNEILRILNNEHDPRHVAQLTLVATVNRIQAQTYNCN